MIKISIDFTELSDKEMKELSNLMTDSFDIISNTKKMISFPTSYKKELTKIVKKLIKKSLREYMFVESANIPSISNTSFDNFDYTNMRNSINFVIKGY